METNSILMTLGIAWLVVYLIGYVIILIRTPSISLGIMFLVFPPLAAFWVLMDKHKKFHGPGRWIWLLFALWAFLPVFAFLVIVMLYGTTEFVNPVNKAPTQ